MRRQNVRQGLQFGGVADLGSRRVGLNVLQRRHVDIRTIGPLHRFDLPLFARRPETFASSIGRNAQSADHGLDGIPIRNCSVQGLQYDRDVTLAQTMPSASASNGRLPVALNALANEKSTSVLGLQSEAPPTIAISI